MLIGSNATGRRCKEVLNGWFRGAAWLSSSLSSSSRWGLCVHVHVCCRRFNYLVPFAQLCTRDRTADSIPGSLYTRWSLAFFLVSAPASASVEEEEEE